MNRRKLVNAGHAGRRPFEASIPRAAFTPLHRSKVQKPSFSYLRPDAKAIPRGGTARRSIVLMRFRLPGGKAGKFRFDLRQVRG
jgi:hypothetical protein